MTGVRGGVTKRGPKVHLDYKQSAGYCWLLLTIAPRDRSRALTLVKTVRRAFRDRDPLTHRGEKSGHSTGGREWTVLDKRRFPTFSAPTLAISLFVDPTDQN